MRIAVVVSYFPSVSQTFVLNQITGLIDRGHEVDIYAAGPEPDENGRALHPDVSRYHLLERVRYEPDMPARPVLRRAHALRILARYYRRDPRAALRTLDPSHHTRANGAGGEGPLTMLYQAAAFRGSATYDVILCHFGPNGSRIARLRAARLVRGRVVTAFHGYDVSRYIADHGESVYADLFREGDLFLPVSRFWRRRLIALGCPPEKIAVHHMGVDLSRFTFIPRYPAADVVRLLTVGRLVEKKGIEYAIRAVASLVRAGVGIDYRIVGTGPLRPGLEQLVRALDLGDVVHLTGDADQKQVVDAMRDAHVFVAPSVTSVEGDMEGIPVSLMEAMACGLPVVSTYHSGIPELVQDGITGFLVPERDAEALAMALRHVASHPSRWPELGGAARAFIEREHDLNALNDHLVALLSGASIPRPADDAPRVSAAGRHHPAAVREDGESAVAPDQPEAR